MKIKFLSALLAVLMFIGTFSAIVLPVSAAEDEEKDIDEIIAEHLTKSYSSPQSKLATMTKKLDKNGYELWVLPETGEIALVDKASGQISFSNPWGIANGTESEATKKEIMSQIFINYNNNGQLATMNSFEEAAQRGQIVVKNIKNGVRIEYTIGREETRLLVPRYIKKARFERQLAKPIFDGMFADGVIKGDELSSTNYLDYVYNVGGIRTKDTYQAFYYNKFLALYSCKDPTDPEVSQQLQTTIYQTWPATRKIGAIFVIAADVSTNELRSHEQIIKQYCPKYTYEELDKDHVECQYEGTDKAPPLFKMALEYRIDEWGLQVTLPASGIRFNESLYQLDNIEVLPFMGAGANPNSGYTFFPDGSGALFDFEQLNTKQKVTISGKVYGEDFAYHSIKATHQEIIRYPVFGIVENFKQGAVVIPPEGGDETDTGTGDESGDETTAPETTAPETSDTSSGEGSGTTGPAVGDIVNNGLLCIIEEGESLATITTWHGGATSRYNTVKMSFAPRPKDSYDLSGSLAVGTGSTWDVVSKRKYVGNYKVRYIMMTDQKIAEENNLQGTYEPTWIGMARAYSAYLVDKGILNRLTEEEVKDDIPLFIETFGTLETLEKILSVPVNVMTPLTSFEDIKTMHNELSNNDIYNITNINFKLTGYANGGIYSGIPSDLKWEKAVGGDDGFNDLVSYAKENGFNVFPDFDFVFVNSSTNTMFDSLNMKKHTVKTIDNRYTSKREYSATYQSYISYFELAVSPEYFMHFYNKLTENYAAYSNGAISVSTLGSYINSNFDEDAPLNREDSKEYTVKLFQQISEQYANVMTDAGNYYSWPYVDYIVNVPISSSRYIKSSNTVPFMGVVLHGFVQFAGTPTNMEGNISYAFLKAIENGSGIYFKLVYQNAEKLKEYQQLSKNYSVRYDIWKDDLIVMYNQLNELLATVQTSTIVGHEFLTGYRIPTDEEKENDAAMSEAEKEQAKLEAEEAKKAQEILDRYNGRTNSLINAEKALANVKTASENILAATTGYYDRLFSYLAHKDVLKKVIERATALTGENGLIAKAQNEYEQLLKDGKTAEADAKKAEFDALTAEYAGICNIPEFKDAEGKSLYPELDAEGDSLVKLTKLSASININIRSQFNNMFNTYNGLFRNTAVIDDNLKLAKVASEYFTVANGFSADLEKEVKDNLAAVEAVKAEALAVIAAAYAKVTDAHTVADAILYEEDPNGEKRVIMTYEEYVKSQADNNNNSGSTGTTTPSTNNDRYLEDSGNIILVTYENGKQIILNYNYFDVTVEVNGKKYTVEACRFNYDTRQYHGYLVINEGGAN